MVIVQRATIELWMNLGGLLSTQQAKVALSYRLVLLLRFFRAEQPPEYIHYSIVARCMLIMSEIKQAVAFKSPVSTLYNRTTWDNNLPFGDQIRD